MASYKSIHVKIDQHIAKVNFCATDKANALDAIAWQELMEIFEILRADPEVRVVILGGEGKHFCSGIDLSMLATITSSDSKCAGRIRESLRSQILMLQASITAIENCNKPVLASVSGGCIGAGMDIITACDMRYASDDAFFAIAEIDIGIVADLGTLQRLPKIVNEGIARELAFTGRKVSGAEAEKIGLINKCLNTREDLYKYVGEIASSIASKSPISIRGTKNVLNYSRDHSVFDGLQYVATWNSAMLLSDDLTEAYRSRAEKRSADFQN